MNDPVADRQRRFRALWTRSTRGGGPDAVPVHLELERLYALPERHYHTMRHVTHCLRLLDQNADLAADPDTLELAIWFHDAVYVPGAPDNEARSAELLETLAEGTIEPARLARTQALILATVHPSDAVITDSRLIADFDLWSFGRSRAAFLRDSVRVRRELGHLSLVDYWTGQRAFLEQLLARPAIYRSGAFDRAHEAAARANIAAYIDAMMRRVGEPTARRAARGRG